GAGVGLAVGVVEAVFRAAWLEVTYSAGEKRTVVLGRQPVTVGGGRDTIYAGGVGAAPPTHPVQNRRGPLPGAAGAPGGGAEPRGQAHPARPGGRGRTRGRAVPAPPPGRPGRHPDRRPAAQGRGPDLGREGARPGGGGGGPQPGRPVRPWAEEPDRPDLG